MQRGLNGNWFYFVRYLEFINKNQEDLKLQFVATKVIIYINNL